MKKFIEFLKKHKTIIIRIVCLVILIPLLIFFLILSFKPKNLSASAYTSNNPAYIYNPYYNNLCKIGNKIPVKVVEVVESGSYTLKSGEEFIVTGYRSDGSGDQKVSYTAEIKRVTIYKSSDNKTVNLILWSESEEFNITIALNNSNYEVQSFNIPTGNIRYFSMGQGIYTETASEPLKNVFNVFWNCFHSELMDVGYELGYQNGIRDGSPVEMENPITYFIAPVSAFLATPLFGTFSIGAALSIVLFVSVALIFLKIFAGG